jgi:hypothetical protein
MTPAKNPRTECCCQSVAFIIAAIVVPLGWRSNARTASCFDEAPGAFVAFKAFLVDVAGVAGVAALRLDRLARDLGDLDVDFAFRVPQTASE